MRAPPSPVPKAVPPSMLTQSLTVSRAQTPMLCLTWCLLPSTHTNKDVTPHLWPSGPPHDPACPAGSEILKQPSYHPTSSTLCKPHLFRFTVSSNCGQTLINHSSQRGKRDLREISCRAYLPFPVWYASTQVCMHLCVSALFKVSRKCCSPLHQTFCFSTNSQSPNVSAAWTFLLHFPLSCLCLFYLHMQVLITFALICIRI